MPLLKTLEDAHEFLYFVATLESGALGKGIGRLQSQLDEYCCLGIGTACLSKKPRVNDEEILSSLMPNSDSDLPNWFMDIDSHYYGLNGKDSLVSLNDSTKDNSHPEIARLLLDTYTDELNVIYEKQVKH